MPVPHRTSYVTALVLLLTCLATRAVAGPCPFGISPETARRLFARLQQISAGDGYRFEGLATNKSEIVVRWSRDGKDCPAIRGRVDTCWSPLGLPTFQLDVPRELAERCPGLQVVVRELGSVAEPRPTRHLAVIALVLVAALLIRRAGWIALALAAALPFLFTPHVALSVGLGAAWLVFAALLFDREILTPLRRTEKLALLGLVPVSLLLDWWLSGGPGDLRMNLAAIWSSELELRWGPAPIALFRLLGAALGGIQDTEIRWCNLILSSLLPVLLYGIVAELEVSRVAALAAAFVTAAYPLLIAFSGTLARPPAYLFAACGSILALIGFLKRGGWNRFVAFVLGAVLATTSRPEGAHVMIVYLAVLLFGPAAGVSSMARSRTRRVAAVALAFLIPLAFAYVHYAVASKPPSGYPLKGPAPLLWTVLFDPDFTPLAWIVAWTLGLLIGAAAGVFSMVRFRRSGSLSDLAPWTDPTGSGLARETPTAGPSVLSRKSVDKTGPLPNPPPWSEMATGEGPPAGKTRGSAPSPSPVSASANGGGQEGAGTCSQSLTHDTSDPTGSGRVGPTARGPASRAAWVALASLLGLHMVWSVTGIYQMFVGHPRQIASSRYEVILVVPFAIGMALLIQAVLTARPRLKAGLVAAFVALTAATYPRPYNTLLRPFTIDYEYRFLKKHALTLPPGSRLEILDAPIDDIGFIDAHLVGQFVGSAVSFGNWSERQCDEAPRDAPQSYLYIGSSCAELIDAPGRKLPADYARWMQECAVIRERVGGDPVEEIDVPARKMSWHDFKDGTVRLGLYRLKDASLCAPARSVSDLEPRSDPALP